MMYIYAAMLIHKAGGKIDEATVKKVVESAGAKADDAKAKALVAALNGVDIEKAIKEAAMPVAAAAPAAGAGKPAEAKKPVEHKKDAEEAAAGLGSLFG